MRFDGKRYRDCKWCYGKGCVYCESEANKAYKREFPDGPKPFATFTKDHLDDAKEVIGMEALKKAFGEGGGGMQELMQNLEKLKEKTGQSYE